MAFHSEWPVLIRPYVAGFNRPLTVGVGFPDQSPEWNTIQAVRRIRNTIVHQQGLVVIAKPDTSLEEAVKRVDHVLIERDRISVDERFSPYFTKIIASFFDLVVNEAKVSVGSA